ncbi:MAG: histidine kinase [Methanomicrobiales archaeon HGW-Methanomicrobiales-4]|nr:MAG: histidine kinase [Methanomicrobiales archaeon HGW-Methanomicrobiales-4]
MEPEKNSVEYQDAHRKVQKLKAFYSNLGAFLIVNLMLIVINLFTSPNILWFYWVTIIWGIFLVWNGFNVFTGEKIMGKDWEEQKIQKYMEKK